jgi:hypothetical protein
MVTIGLYRVQSSQVIVGVRIDLVPTFRRVSPFTSPDVAEMSV